MAATPSGAGWSRTSPCPSLKPAKDKSTERIDGIVALIMAIGRAMLPGEQPGLSVYEDRGILIL
jgi:phage terminase large subunit-like protein